MSKFLKVIVNIFLIGAILAAVAILVPPVLGVSTTIVESSSMSTNLRLGSITYATTVDVSEIEAGDEVLKENGTAVYAYIVRTADPTNGEFVCVSATDPDGQEETVILRNTVSKVAVSVPYLGYLVIAMNSFEGRLIIGLVVALIVILFILSELWKEVPEDEEIDEDEAAEEQEEDEEEAYPAELTAREETGIDTAAIREAVEENRAAEEAEHSEASDEGSASEEEAWDDASGEPGVDGQTQGVEEYTDIPPETPLEESNESEGTEPEEKLTWAERRAARKARKRAEKEAEKRAQEEAEEEAAKTVSAFEIPHPEKLTDTATTPEEAAQALDEASRTSGIYESEAVVNAGTAIDSEEESGEEVPEDLRDMLQEAERELLAAEESVVSDISEGGAQSGADVREQGETKKISHSIEEGKESAEAGIPTDTDGVESFPKGDETAGSVSEEPDEAGYVDFEETLREYVPGEHELQKLSEEEPAAAAEGDAANLTDVTEEPVVLGDGRFVPAAHPTLEEIRRQAKNAGDAPKETRDDITGITVVDYTGIL